MITLINIRSGRTFKIKDEKKFISFAYNCCIDNWEMHSKSYKEYCKLYGHGELTTSGEYKWDRYLDRLERAERKEFKENAMEIFKKYSPIWKIVQEEQEELCM